MNAIKPGDHRCPGPSTRDILLEDKQDLPWQLLESSNQFAGSDDIAYERYTSAEFMAKEFSDLWPRVWQWVARSEQLQEVGDLLTYDIGPYSLLVARTREGIKVFHNACLHRGTQLRPSDTVGYGQSLRCPYHGWEWTLEGELAQIPCQWDFPHVDKQAYRLPQVRVEEWGGFVFVNIDGQAEPLMEYLGPLAKHLDGSWDMARRATTIHIRKELPTNWKAAQEAFLEAYHVMETHSQNLPYAGDANAQYDLFGPNVSRFVHTHGVPSPHIAKAMTQQEICDLMHLPKGTVVAEGSTARRTAADHRRKTAGAKWGLDLNTCTDSEMLDSIEYHLFPNMCIFPGISLPMVYRFRPIDMDPGRTMFDLLFLRPLGPDEDMPEPPEPVDLGPDVSYAQVPGLEPWLAATFDQDTENLRRQFRGFTISQKRGETLGNYQESRIRHFHEGIDRYLGAKPA